MTEPMTSGEIEDVLSSIRKLVSEDLRPQPRVPAPDAAPDTPPEADKLILTPALRVVEGSAEAEATLAAAEVAEAEPDPEPARRLRLDTVVSAFATQVNPPPEGWEAETGDATVTHLLRTPPGGHAPAVEPFPDASAEDESPSSGDIPDAEIVDGNATGGLHFARQARRAGLADADDEPPAAPPEAEVLRGAAEVPEAPMLDLHADALADLVRDILREELQGPLGERMTRNIRKLVRAEVARMLATKDLA
jgi:hypothetical protein